jgi:dimethylargininase
MLRALTRQVSPSFASCELTFLERQPIDVAKAILEHRNYEACLSELGANVTSLPADPAFPDGVFVEDAAIVLDEVAIITRPGAESRRGETESIARALSDFRELRYIREPATLEGGDVLFVGRTLYVGLSRRTNREGVAQLADIVDLFGYQVVPVEVTGCLHLKSGACWAGGDVILANREWVDIEKFRDFRIIDVSEEEPSAADVLPIGGTLLVPSNFVRTGELLQAAGINVRPIDVSELQKAEAGVTCMSLLFEGS